jgi:hypothetical protein
MALSMVEINCAGFGEGWDGSAGVDQKGDVNSEAGFK